MNRKEKSVIHSWLAMALVLLFIIVIIIFYINKLKEKEVLKKLRLSLLSRKETLEELKRNKYIGTNC